MGNAEPAGRCAVFTLERLHMAARVQHHDRQRLQPQFAACGQRLADDRAGFGDRNI
jgi:hypothetical protein